MAIADFRIPDDLVGLLAQRRVIPFIGAGFSSVHAVPGWESLLKELSEEIQAGADVDPVLSYKEISDACGGDNLQIAEYLYLIGGESIGPIRQGLSTSLQTEKPLLSSTPHVELVNLGTPHVYTTNFDDLIEKTYRELDLPVDVIAVPRDMALSHADRTEVVKYHGDLRHEATLVLTESQYYTRLEFESPMDLKFRSDLLGRSVLFMGYSFRDINIRVIWFRLMQMMQDVPQKDLPPSYIVRLRPNPVLDTLYEGVGLRTLVIDPEGQAETTTAQNALLSEFLLELSLRCSRDGRIPGTDRGAFVSMGLVEQTNTQIKVIRSREGRIARTASGRIVRARGSRGDALPTTLLVARLDQLRLRQIPEPLAEAVAALLLDLARTVDTSSSRADLPAQLATWFTRQRGPAPGATLLVARSLMRAQPRRAVLDSSGLGWEAVWTSKLDADDIQILLRAIESEVTGHEDEDDGYTDEDVAYAVDLAKRIANGQIDGADSDEHRKAAEDLIARAAEIYPAVADYDPPPKGRPNPKKICEQITARTEELEEAADEEEEEEG